MMDEQTNETINKTIAKFMGRCWHVVQLDQRKAGYGQCVNEGCDVFVHRHPNRDYCSPDSPRRLLDEVVAKAVQPNKYAAFEDALFNAIRKKHSKDNWEQYNNSYLTYLFINAAPEQIARAIFTCITDAGQPDKECE